MICNPGPSCWSETVSLNQVDNPLYWEQNVLSWSTVSTGLRFIRQYPRLAQLCLNVTYPLF